MSLGGFIVQLEPDTCRMRWQLALGEVSRLLRAGDRLFVCAHEHVHAIDHDTGRYVGAAAVGFRVRAAVCDGDRVVVACATTAACVDRNGALLWTASVVPASPGLLSPEEQIVIAHDHERRELWRTPPGRSGCAPPGLLLGAEVGQPDLA